MNEESIRKCIEIDAKLTKLYAKKHRVVTKIAKLERKQRDLRTPANGALCSSCDGKGVVSDRQLCYVCDGDGSFPVDP